MTHRDPNAPTNSRIPFLIGVVGHRDLVDSQVAQIGAALSEILKRLKSGYPDVPFKLLCSMAQGADLLAASIAVELGIDTIALLPYGQARCRADLTTEQDRRQFDLICMRSEIIELPPLPDTTRESLQESQPARDEQLRHAASLIARYSGLLLVVWDGLDTPHRAGTARTVEFRRNGTIPRLEVDAEQRNNILVASHDDLNYEIRCSRTSREPRSEVQVIGFTGSQVSNGTKWPRALEMTLDRIGEYNREVARFGARIDVEGQRLAQPSPYAIPERMQYLNRMFIAADWLGSHFRRAFTRALKARYGLWALMALLLITFKKESTSSIAVLCISGVLAVFLAGTLLALWANRRGWHRKYLDYRALAEALRVDFHWEVSGVRREFEGEFAHESFLQQQDADLDWIRIAMRAISLQLAVRPPEAFAHGYPFTFAAWVGDDDPVNGTGQMHYYRQRLEVLKRKTHRAEIIDRSLLFAGLALAVAFAFDAGLRAVSRFLLPEHLHDWLLWALTLLPVYAAIFEIYLNEKADRALIRQYRYMYSLFFKAAGELRGCRSEERRLSILRSLGHACLAEHAQWILAHRDKRIQGMRW